MNARLVCGVLAAALLACAAAAWGAETEQPSYLPRFDLRFDNFFLYQNDSDFDRTAPLYDKNGQSVGYFLTVLRPGLTWTPIEMATVRWQAKIGENVWSLNDAEQGDATSPDIMIFETEEVWGEARFPQQTAVRMGYQRLYDPARLFLDRHVGAAMIRTAIGDTRFALLGGQIPDLVYEGTTAEPASLALSQNNFKHDVFFYGVQAALPAGSWTITPAIWGLEDRSDVERTRSVVNPVAHVEGPLAASTSMYVDAAMQWGLYRHGGIGEQDQDLLGWAGQFGVHWNGRPARVRFNALAFSGDDGDPNDLRDTSYLYSGKNNSATLMLSEDELQDQYDNLDERTAAQKAGMFLADLRVGVFPHELAEIFAVGGAGRALQTRTLDHADATIATEADFGVTWTPYPPHVSFTAVGVGLWPGEAGAMLRNAINLTKLDPIYNGQFLMELAF
jgi:hypothetical protein